MGKLKYLPPPENLDGLNPIQRFMQRESTMEDYFYLALFVLCYIAARPSIKKGAEWLLATPEYKEGKRKQQEYEAAMAKAQIGANAIRGQKETPAQLLVAEGGATAVETAATAGQVQNRKTKGAGASKSEVDKLLDWDDEPARPKQKGDSSDVVAWLDNSFLLMLSPVSPLSFVSVEHFVAVDWPAIAPLRYAALGLSKLALGWLVTKPKFYCCHGLASSIVAVQPWSTYVAAAYGSYFGSPTRDRLAAWPRPDFSHQQLHSEQTTVLPSLSPDIAISISITAHVIDTHSSVPDSTPKVQQHVDLSASRGRNDPSPADEAAYKSGLERSEEARDYNKMRPRIIYDNLPARKIHAYDPADNAARRPGQVLQRTRPGNARADGSGDAGALGRVQRLRITDADEDDGLPDLSQRRRGSRRSPSTAGASAAVEDGDHDPDEDLDDPALDFEEEPSLADQAAFEREVSRLPSDNPTTVQPYNPVPPSLSDLEKYWPNTPLSAMGLRASVSQHLAPLANRQTTSFWTPLQLAQQFVSGQFISLHSESEKKAMMEFVPRLLAEKAEAVEKYAQARSERDAANFNADAFHAKRKAARLPDTNPNGLPEFVSLTDRRLATDATEVVTQIVRGRYEHPNAALDQAKWGKMKWMGDVERNLTVNETYGPADRAKFLGRLTDMVKEMQQQGAKSRAKKQKQAA
ncbi:hypothetical protein DV738_g3368, partial [Chaetothyriales sp. CBS 135597]